MLSQCSGDFCFVVITNHYHLIATDFDSLVVQTFKPEEGGALLHMGYMGMCRSTGYAFCLADSGTGYKNHPFSLRVYFTLGLTLEQGRFFPEP